MELFCQVKKNRNWHAGMSSSLFHSRFARSWPLFPLSLSLLRCCCCVLLGDSCVLPATDKRKQKRYLSLASVLVDEPGSFFIPHHSHTAVNNPSDSVRAWVEGCAAQVKGRKYICCGRYSSSVLTPQRFFTLVSFPTRLGSVRRHSQIFFKKLNLWD